MRTVVVTADHRLEVQDTPEPRPDEGEVLVDVIAAGVNRADLAQAAGTYPPPPGASPILGLEVSGRRRDTGEEVVALLAGGGYAETVAVPEAQLLPMPRGLSPIEAAGLVEVAATVVSNLVLEAGLPVETPEGAEPTRVLVHGGTGGIGSFALQFARTTGARVFTTVGSAEAVRHAEELGAERAWNRHTDDVGAAVERLGGVDIILVVVGGPAVDTNVRMLAEFGRLVVIGTLGGSTGTLDVGTLMSRRARVIGTTLRSRGVDDKARILRRTRELVWPLIEDGTIRVPVEAVHPLEDAGSAHAVLARGGHVGKVVLAVRD
ncbi:NAD(P)H-quinone oxidoreductase [uncultured Microbacterium sp.]|uniref:NAD(P)H-quinone oxidoreductase n=1 Tax=uncultured Microbacterium sp. TaxID=191216 RepID=UPI0028DD3408|nr:NAD(P)H-quinone oxidoreductase [uncultured Microbacterium sp.]